MTSGQAIRVAQVHVPDPCAWCEGLQDVNWYCIDCKEALCDGCKDNHQRARKTKHDVVVPFETATKEEQTFIPEICTTHHSKSCDLFCCDCEIAICAICFTEKHNTHVFKTIEDEIDKQRQFLQDQLTTLDSKLDFHNNSIFKRHEASKAFAESVDAIRQTVQAQKVKLQADITSISDSVLVELSSLVEQEEISNFQDCKPYEKNVEEIKQLKRDVEQVREKKSSESLFEVTRRMRTTLPSYGVVTKSVLPREPHFIPAKLKQNVLKTMFGFLQVSKNAVMEYEKNEIDSQHAQIISTFQVQQQTQVISMCPFDDYHVWMSVHSSNELIKISKEGKVTESIMLDFKPWHLTVSNEKDILITEHKNSPMIRKVSHERQVTVFADISPSHASGICVSDTDDVFVTTLSSKTLVLNMSGERIRQISYGGVGHSILRLTTGHIAVTTGHDHSSCNELMIMKKSGEIIHRWSGELDSGLKIDETVQSEIASDKYDRIFIPDYNSNQVYVLSGYEKKAKCLLDKTHGVTDPLSVCVDQFGHVWIGCSGGYVHVIQI